MYDECMSLAQVTKETRLILKIGGAFIVLLIVLFLVFKGGNFFLTTFFPKPPAPPQEKFGKLAPISFPESTNSVPKFNINTVSGTLPVFPTTINVYKLKEYVPTITALQSAKIKAGSLGYTQNQQAVSTTEYRWTKPDSQNSLLYNIINFNFSVESDFLTDPNLTVGDLSRSKIVDSAASFIDALGTDKVDIDLSKSVVTYYIISNGQLSEVRDASSGSVARVYLIQNPVDTLPIYYPTTDPSLLYLTLSGSGPSNVVSASYNHFAPDVNQSSTYPLLTAAQALSALKDGKGYIVKPTTAGTVDITDVQLGYYLNGSANQKYLMPIVVFFGANNFEAYVNAIY